jgi:hypothetical protein
MFLSPHSVIKTHFLGRDLIVMTRKQHGTNKKIEKKQKRVTMLLLSYHYEALFSLNCFYFCLFGCFVVIVNCLLVCSAGVLEVC